MDTASTVTQRNTKGCKQREKVCWPGRGKVASGFLCFSLLFLNKSALIFGTQARSSQRRHWRVTGLEPLSSRAGGHPRHASDMAYEMETGFKSRLIKQCSQATSSRWPQCEALWRHMTTGACAALGPCSYSSSTRPLGLPGQYLSQSIWTAMMQCQRLDSLLTADIYFSQF